MLRFKRPFSMLEDIEHYSKEELYGYLEQIIQDYEGDEAPPASSQRTSGEDNSRPGTVSDLLNAAELLQQDVLQIVKKFRQLNIDLEQEVAQRSQELAIKEANLTALIENTSDFILSINRDFQVLVINSALQQHLYRTQGLWLQPGSDLLALCSAEQIAFWRPYFEKAVQGDAFKLVRGFEGEQKKAYYEFSYNPISDRKGQVTGVSFFAKDITAKQAALEETKAKEQLLASINHSIKEGIFRTHRGHIIYVNKAFAEMFGYSSEEEVMQLDPYDLYVVPSRRDDFVNLMQRQTFFVNEEVQFRRKDGSTFWGLMSSIKTYDAAGNLYYDGAVRDVTEIKEARWQLEEQNRELRKVNQELDRFVYSTSHDLRAPLVSISGLIQVARLAKDEEEREQYFGLMEKSIKKLDGFIQDIIHYSRNSRTELRREAINFQQLLSNIEEELRYQDGSNPTELSIEEEGEGEFFSDPVRLGIIFSNLISNSIRYQDPNKPQNRVGIRIEHRPGEVQLALQDNGIGIAPEFQARVFDMFFRGTQRSQGSGIGLYIVQETVTKLQGEIDLASEPGVGTTFYLRFPSLAAPSGAAATN